MLPRELQLAGDFGGEDPQVVCGDHLAFRYGGDPLSGSSNFGGEGQFHARSEFFDLDRAGLVGLNRLGFLSLGFVDNTGTWIGFDHK